MPSFIYIARIRSLSEELAQSLRSAGCHVESFKPGQVTQDECLLAMTPEAADGALHPDRAGTETERKGSGVPAAPTVPLPQTDTAVWDSLKTAIAKEFRENVEPTAATATAVETATETEVKERAFAPKPAEHADGSTSGKVNPQHPRIEPPPIVAVSSMTVSTDPTRLRPAMERFYRVLRNPLSTVAAVLVFGILYRGLPAMTAAGQMVTRSEAAGPVLAAEPSHGKMQTVQRRQSSDGAVAEDFTRRVAMQASTAAGKNLDLKSGQGASIQKRIVMD